MAVKTNLGATDVERASSECEPASEARAAREHLDRVMESLPPVVANPQYATAYGASHAAAAASGECPFCKPEWQAEALHDYEGWIVRLNPFPGKDRLSRTVRHHLLFAKRSHEGPEYQLTPDDLFAIGKLKEACYDEFHVGTIGLALRDGEPVYAGRTIVHPHLHGVVPNVLTVTAVNGVACAPTQIVVPFDFPFG